MEREHSDRLLRITGAAVSSDNTAPPAVLHKAFQAIIEGDFEAFGRSVTDDVALNILGLGALNGSWRGRASVIAAARKNFGLLAEQKPEIESMIADGDRIAVLVRETGIFKSSGQIYRVRGVQWFTFADGKIAKIDEIIAESPR